MKNKRVRKQIKRLEKKIQNSTNLDNIIKWRIEIGKLIMTI